MSRGRAATPRLEMLEARALLAVYTVTNTLDGVTDVGSLRWAVTEANFTTRGLDFINFNIPGAGVQTIKLGAQLFLNDQVVIDGTSQPGYAGQPLIYVQGGSGSSAFDPAIPWLFTLQERPGGERTSTGSTIQGLGMYSFSLAAVSITSGSTYNYIQDNSIGFFPNGASPFLNTGVFSTADGVGIQSAFTVVRGNTISGVRNGVAIGDTSVGGTTNYVTNAIQGNNIGTDRTGSTSAGYGNLLDGILLLVNAKQNFIGPGNVVSGNRHGIHLSHSSNAGNVVFQNMIGTNRAGNGAIGNRNLGVLLAPGASGNAVGGYYDGNGGNLIAGNAGGGVGLSGASGNWVQKNNIGLNRGQSAAIGSQATGLIVSGGSRNVIEENIMAGHVEQGILMENTESNYLSKNFVGINEAGTWYANGGYGIALLSGASRNFVLSTTFGENRRGNLLQDPGAVGNVF